MKQNPKSKGKCLFCEKTFAKSGINRHLKTHLEEKTADGKTGISYLIKVEVNPIWDSTPYFLSLWIDGETTMDQLDQFLRDIWLECCGHLSVFCNPKKKIIRWSFFEIIKMIEQGRIEEHKKREEANSNRISMKQKVKDVFHKILKLEYTYDFVSSTELCVTVIQEFPIEADEEIVLLSRNEPLEWLCDKCNKEKAIQICSIHNWEHEGHFCAKCVKEHAKTCKNFTAMPIVNSPRAGVCKYEGGVIDIEREDYTF